jgi:SAM-dependent methyltransferase
MNIVRYLIGELGRPERTPRKINAFTGPSEFYYSTDEPEEAVVKRLRETSRDVLRKHYDSLTDDDWDYLACIKSMQGMKRYLMFVSEKIRSEKPRIVVEGGCGAGYDVAFLAKEFPGIAFNAYDISEGNIEKSARRAERHGTKNVRLAVASHDDYEFPENTDMIYLHSSFGEEQKVMGQHDNKYIWAIEDERLERFHHVLKDGKSFIPTFHVLYGTSYEPGGYDFSFGRTIENHGFERDCKGEIIMENNETRFCVFHYKAKAT